MSFIPDNLLPIPTLVLFQGDDTDFRGNQSIEIKLDTQYDLTGCKINFKVRDIEFNNLTVLPYNIIRLTFTSEQTASLTLGSHYATLWMYDENNKKRTISNTLKIVATRSVFCAYGADGEQSIILKPISDMEAFRAYIPRQIDDNGVLVFNTENTVFKPGCVAVGDKVLQYAFTGNQTITTADFSKMKTANGNLSFYKAFMDSPNLTTVKFHSLKEITSTIESKMVFGEAFKNCPALTKISFPNLLTISMDYAFYHTFDNCENLDTVNLKYITNISGKGAFYGAFFGCSKLESLTFYSLTSITNPAHESSTEDAIFGNNDKLKIINLPCITSIEGAGNKNLFNGCTSLSEIHFTMGTEATIKAMAGYETKWGAPNDPQILFDL